MGADVRREGQVVRVAERGRGRPVPYLRAWRMYRALSQVMLAQRAHVNVSTISRAERAPGQRVSWESIGRLAAALGTRADQLWLEAPPDGTG